MLNLSEINRTYNKLLSCLTNVYKASFIDFILINRCNKSCFYCDIPGLEANHQITFDDLPAIDHYMQLCFNLNKRYNINKKLGFTGGELGLLKVELLHEIKELCKKYYQLYNTIFYFDTNGLLLDNYIGFLENEYLYVNHHITDDQLDSIVLKSAPNIIYNIVIHDDNYEKVMTFISQHKDYHFYVKQCHNMRVKDIPPFQTDFNYSISKRLCSKVSPYFQLDFTNYTINKCCKSYTAFQRKPLNYNNVLKAYESTLFDASPICEDRECYMFDGYHNTTER